MLTTLLAQKTTCVGMMVHLVLRDKTSANMNRYHRYPYLQLQDHKEHVRQMHQCHAEPHQEGAARARKGEGKSQEQSLLAQAG